MPHHVVLRAAARHEPEPALLCAAAALSRGDTAACEEALGHAERALARLPDADGEHSATIRLTQAVITIERTRTSDLPCAMRAAAAVQALFGEVSRNARRTP